MAKGNLFLGQARGKVGSVVFARAFGEQITRTRPTSVANPKTIGQNTQRAILATIAKSAALLTPIVDHSFANVTYGAESVRHFRKLNMGILRNTLLSSVGTNYNLSARGANAVPNALKISEGNLPAFSSAYQDDQIGFYMGGALSSITECSVEQFKAAYPYIQGGDQLTIVKLVKTSGSLLDGDAVFALKVDRIVFATNAFDDASSELIDDTGYFVTSKLDLTKTTSTTAIQGVDAGGGKGIGCTTDNDNTYAATLILSRKVNNVWQRSTQFLELSEYDDATDNQAAIDSYGASASLNDATEYLNQAEESTSEAGIRGAYADGFVFVNGAEQFANPVNAGQTRSATIEVTAGQGFELQVFGYGTSENRLVTTEVINPNGVVVVHGARYAKASFTMSGTIAGVYKLIALFADGKRSEFNITISLSA